MDSPRHFNWKVFFLSRHNSVSDLDMMEADGSREAVAAAVENVPDEGVTADPDQEVSEPGTPKKQHKVVADRWSEVRVELVYSSESDAAASAEQSSPNGKITQV